MRSDGADVSGERSLFPIKLPLAIPIAAVLGLVLKLPFVTAFIIMQICDDIAKNPICFIRCRKGNRIKPVRRIRFD